MYEHITRAALTELLKLQGQTFVSLYMPMERTFPEREQNNVRYRNLLRQLREQMDGATAPTEQKLLQQFEALLNEDELWNSPRSGLAVLGSEDLFRVFSLHHVEEERNRVDRPPYLQPLLRISHVAVYYPILGVHRTA